MKKSNGLGISRKKEFYLGLTLSLIVLMILFFVNISATYTVNKKETIEKKEIVTENIEKHVKNTLKAIDNVSKDSFLCETFQTEVSNIYDSEKSLTAIKNINLLFENNMNGFETSFVKDICYVPKNSSGEFDIDNYIHYGFSSTIFSTTHDKNLNAIATEASLEKNIKGNLFVGELRFFGEETELIYFARNIIGLHNDNFGEKLGIGIIVINKSSLIDLLDYSFIIDGLVTSVSCGEETHYYSSNFNDISITSDSIIEESRYIGFYDWSITTYYDSNYFLNSIEKNLYTSIFVMLIVLVIYIISYFIFHRKNLKSLYYLFNNFSQISKDTTLRPMQYTNDYEINYVIQAYNEMVESISTLNRNIIFEKDRALQSEIQSKDFEIKSLYAQINKHFIINVLSIVHSLINLKQIENANYCLENLSDFLRYSLTMESNSCFKDELFNIKSYFNIQTIRYPNVSYHIEFDPNLNDVKVPKLLVQPLVENAYVHGLKKKVGTIDVSCRMENKVIYISVIDDGGTTTSKELDDLNNKIMLCDETDSKFEKLHGIALINIQKRLNLMYGLNKARLRLRITDDNKTESLIVIELE